MAKSPDPTPIMRAERFLSPASFVRAAQGAHPAFKFAMVVAGLAALVVIFSKFGVGYPALIFGVIIILALMVLFVVFAQAAKLAKIKLELPAQILVWAILALAILVNVFLLTSTFFDNPLPFRSWIIRELGVDRLRADLQSAPTPSPAGAAVNPTQRANANATPQAGFQSPRPEEETVLVERVVQVGTESPDCGSGTYRGTTIRGLVSSVYSFSPISSQCYVRLHFNIQETNTFKAPFSITLFNANEQGGGYQILNATVNKLPNNFTLLVGRIPPRSLIKMFVSEFGVSRAAAEREIGTVFGEVDVSY